MATLYDAAISYDYAGSYDDPVGLLSPAPVPITPPGGKFVRAIPEITWTLGGQVIDADPGWGGNCVVGGYDQAQLTVPLSQWRSVPGAGQGSVLKAYQDNGDAVWEGTITAPPQITDGRASLLANGYKVRAEKTTQPLLVSTNDMTQWTSVDSDPYSGGDNYKKITLGSGNHPISWQVARNVDLDKTTADNGRYGYAFTAEGCTIGGVGIRQVQFDMRYVNADQDSNLEIQTVSAGVVGGNAYDLSSTSSGNTYATNGANQNQTQTSGGFATTRETIVLYLHVNTNETPADLLNYWANHVTVWGPVTTNNVYNASDVVSYVGSILPTPWDTSGVVSSSYDITPLWWTQSSLMDLLLYLADLEDKFIRVLDNRGSGPYVEYGAWGSTNWKVQLAHGATPDLVPLELFDGVRVPYQTPHGITRSVTVRSATTPYGNIFETAALEDPQPDEDLATRYATALLSRLSTQRYKGSLDVVRAYDANGRNNIYGIRAGDTVTISDWDQGTSQSLRVTEASYSLGSVHLGIEQPYSLSHLLAASAGHKRHRKHH